MKILFPRIFSFVLAIGSVALLFGGTFLLGSSFSRTFGQAQTATLTNYSETWQAVDGRYGEYTAEAVWRYKSGFPAINTLCGNSSYGGDCGVTPLKWAIAGSIGGSAQPLGTLGAKHYYVTSATYPWASAASANTTCNNDSARDTSKTYRASVGGETQFASSGTYLSNATYGSDYVGGGNYAGSTVTVWDGARTTGSNTCAVPVSAVDSDCGRSLCQYIGKICSTDLYADSPITHQGTNYSATNFFASTKTISSSVAIGYTSNVSETNLGQEGWSVNGGCSATYRVGSASGVDEGCPWLLISPTESAPAAVDTYNNAANVNKFLCVEQ